MQDVQNVLIVAGVVALAGAAAWLSRRRGTDAPTQPAFAAPTQIDRADLGNPAEPWVVTIFASETCDACAGVIERAEPLRSSSVGVQVRTFQADGDLHRRYRIDAVPLTLIVGPDGSVPQHFFGPVSATHLWAAVAEAREPGSVPRSDSCDGQH